MAEPVNDYRLVVFDAPSDPHAVRDLVCGVTGAHPTDAMQWVARSPGIWLRPLGEGEVRELLDGLYEMGIAAEAWRVDRLPNLHPIRNVHTAACLPEGFRVEGLRGEPIHWVPWSKIDLIHAGRVQVGDEVREVVPPRWTAAVATGFNALMGRAPRSSRRGRALRVPRDPVGEVLIIRRDPLLAFRIAEDQMNYAYLGNRLKPSASENFPQFLADLCGRADQAYITPVTRQFLERAQSQSTPPKTEPIEPDFPSSQALLDDAILRLLWCWYRRDRDSQQQTEAF